MTLIVLQVNTLIKLFIQHSYQCKKWILTFNNWNQTVFIQNKSTESNVKNVAPNGNHKQLTDKKFPRLTWKRLPCRCWKPAWRSGRRVSTRECLTVPRRLCRRKEWRPSTRATSPTSWASSPMLASTWPCMRLAEASLTSGHTWTYRSHVHSGLDGCLLPPELEEPVVVPLLHRHGQPRHPGAAGLWNHLQLLWPVGQLPSGADPYQDAGAR